MKQSAWTNIGENVKGNNVEEVLKSAGLNYNVVKEPIYTESRVRVPGKFVTKIDGSSRPEDIFGVVGNDYTIVQNSEAFDFVNELVPEGLQFEKAGQTHWGMVYMIASLPEYKLFGDDMKTYMIFQNTHNGISKIMAALCPLRIVCQNQFAVAFKRAENKVVIKHTRSASSKLDEAREVMRAALGYTEEFKMLAEELAAIKVPKIKEEKVLELMFPINETKDSERKVQSIMERRSSVSSLFHNDNDLQNFKGTAWGMLNAYSDYITHAEPQRKTENWEQSRFWNTTMNTSNMDKLIDIIKTA